MTQMSACAYLVMTQGEKKTQMLQLNQMITHQCSAVSNEFDFEGTTFPAALFDVGHVILLFHLNHSKTYV